MPRFLLTCLIVLFAVFLQSPAFAGQKITPLKTAMDSSTIAIRPFNKKALQVYKADKDFNYTGQGIGRPSAWSIFWQWLWGTIARMFSRVPYGATLLQYLLAIISIAFLVYIIFKSLGIDPVKLWRGEAAKISIPYTESLENIHDIDFDAEIEKAITQHNYRLAVRLLYLKCLKQLSDKNLIQWQIDKTNAAYIYELENQEQKKTFRLLTRRFEYVWYGNFSINKQAFTDIELLFQNFKQQLP